MPGATGNYGAAPKRSFGDMVDDAAIGVLPYEPTGTRFARPAARDDNPKVAHPAPFAKTARDEVRPRLDPVAATRVTERREDKELTKKYQRAAQIRRVSRSRSR